MSAGNSLIRSLAGASLFTLLFAATACATEDSSKALTKRLENSHIFAPGVKVKVICDDRKIAVSTYKHPYGTQLDLRIDALLVGRELLATQLVGVPNIDVYFFEPDNHNEYLLVTLKRTMLEKFKHGTTSIDDLMSEVQIKQGRLAVRPYQSLANQSYEEIASHIEPIAGTLKDQRARLITEVQGLDQTSTEANQLKSACMMFEDAARQNDDLGVRAAFAYAEELLQNARRTATDESTQ